MLYRLVTSYKLQQQDLVAKFRASVRASVVILPILGFTWIFAILDYFFDEVACKYFFAILNSLQGFCIFLFHCVINEQVNIATIFTHPFIFCISVSPFVLCRGLETSIRGFLGGFLFVPPYVRCLTVASINISFCFKAVRRILGHRVRMQASTKLESSRGVRGHAPRGEFET